MRRIVRNMLIVLVLVPAMAQSGMASLMPLVCAKVAHEAGAITAYSGLTQENHAHHAHHGSGSKVSDGKSEYHCLTCIDGACGDCLDCFVVNCAMSLSADIAWHIPDPGVYKSLVIASVTSVYLVPPTPPPRL